MDIKDLIPLLRAHGVKKYKDSACEIEFEPKELEPLAPKAIEPAPPGIPPEIHNPDLMNADAIKNWSAPPSPYDQEEAPLPLTGEDP